MSVTRLRRLVSIVVAAIVPPLAACGGGPTVDAPADDPQRIGDARPAVVTGDQAADRATLLRLEAAARALAHTEGCTAASCAAQPIGAKACGGPRYYVPYCRLTTDVPALERAAAEVERFERSFNERYGVASTCEFAVPPGLTVVSGACTATLR